VDITFADFQKENHSMVNPKVYPEVNPEVYPEVKPPKIK